jgi:hypothetical protein
MKYLFIFLLSLSLSAADFGEQLKPFIEQYCVDCHGPKKEKGDLRLDTLKTELTDLETAEKWQHVLDELNGATMPPEDEKQPQAKELTQILEMLTYELELAKKKLYGKDRHVVMRKLNKREYINTILELTGIPLNEFKVPDDGRSTEFDTNGKGLFMSAYLFNKYRQLAGDALGYAIENRSGGWAIDKVIEAENKRLKDTKKAISRIKKGPKIRKGAAQTKKKKVSSATIAKNVARMIKVSEHPAGKDFSILGTARSKQGNFIKEIEYEFFGNEFEAGLYTFKIRGGHIEGAPGDRIRVALTSKLGKARQELAVFEFTQSYENPQDFECTVLLEKKDTFYLESRVESKKKGAFVYAAVDKLQLIGPLKKASHKKIIPFPQGDLTEHEYALKLMSAFTKKAFRNTKPTEKFMQTLENYYELNRSKGMPLLKAIQGPLAIVLSSPKFLYRVEQDSKFISDTELASRLSFFLWSSPPDTRLMTYAKAGKLSQPKVLQSEVVRMLKDKRSLDLAKGFVPQWLDMHKLAEVDVNKRRFKSYNGSIGEDVKLETIHFFHTLVTKNLKIDNFIDSDFVVVNNNLKAYYGLEGRDLDGFQPLKLPKNSDRGGLLGQASVLMMTGNGERSSPVMRGTFILSKMMGMPSPEPPPNVPQLDNENSANMTPKEALRVHQEQPQCQSCHKRIDPAGFGLERFDAAGLLKPLSKPKKPSDTVDSNGALPNGQAFTDHHGLKKLLMSQKSKFAKSLIEALMGYAFGRTIGFADELTIDELLIETKNTDYRLGSLIINIVKTPEFRMK